MTKGRTTNRPHRLFDFLIEKYGIKSDYQLAHLLEIGQSAVCKYRAGRPITANVIIRVHETFDLPIKDIKALI